ncbi:uncharacterized protein VTP21DRAFT_6116 [Calcarisporiella thermophila]|uniref:uncharacterized protein n=1 Tax=Calcarisporiella thermophila TaxID=911321 RepID=UPI003744632D
MDSKLSADFVSLTDDHGLKKRVIRPSDRDHVPVGSRVSVHYTGTLYPSGEKFDSSRDRNSPFSFDLGRGQVIKGWDLGVKTMRVGEVAELLCEPDYAYGQSGSPPLIPPNSTLKFEVEVLSFKESLQSAGQKLKAALKKRDEGNALFKASDYAAAQFAYSKGLEYLDDQATVGEGRFVGSDEEMSERATLLGVLRLNLAACLVKTNSREAVKVCERILREDKGNVKARYRLAQALMGVGEFERGLAEVEELVRMGEEKSVGQLRVQLLKALEGHKRKEKEMYRAMFSK